MKYIKCISILLVTIFIFSSFSSTATARSHPRIIDKILVKFFEKTVGSILFPWGVLRFTEPDPFIVEPNTVNMSYLDRKEIIIGVKDPNTGEYESLENYEMTPLFKSQDFEFKLEIPDDIPKNMFNGHFEPQFLVAGSKKEFKTRLILTSNFPKNIALPKNIVVTVNITKYITGGNLYLPPKGQRFPVYNFLWFLWSNGIGFPFPYGRYYSGRRVPDYSININILVNLEPYHVVEIITPERIEMKPDEIRSIPVEIKNHGRYVDSLNFRVITDSDSELLVSPPPTITLNPNEVVHTVVGIASPLRFSDPGTAHQIKIEAYSIYDENKVYNNTFMIVTRGVYMSEIGTIYLLISLFVLVIGIYFYLYIQRKRLEMFCIKPYKPWEIPKEKEHLEKLRQKDPKEYEETLNMMKQEYQSALLWYKHYCKYILKKEKTRKKKEALKIKKSKNKEEKLFKKEEKRVKEKKKPLMVEKKIEKSTPVVKALVDKNREKELREKERLMLKLKREQEKQKKRMRI